MTLTLRQICHALEVALLHDGEMHRALYAWEMEEHVDDWRASMQRDRDAYLFVVNVRVNDLTHQPNTALLLLEPPDVVTINEAARDRLRALWAEAYEDNVRRLIPSFAQQLKAGELPVHGVKTVPGIAQAKVQHPPRWH